MKWISIEDEIPPSMISILLACDEGIILGWQEGDIESGEDICFCCSELTEPQNVTHWMYLPDHPKNSRIDKF